MIEKKIKKIISPSLNKMGFQIFRLKLEKNSKSNSILQIMIEYINGKPININDCSKISKHVSVLLDVEGVMDFSYNLEISSPGINRPLEAIGDFVKFIGKLISIELNDETLKKRKIKAKILSVEKNIIKILETNKNEEMLLPISQISRSHLIYEKVWNVIYYRSY